MKRQRSEESRTGQRVALFIAGVGLLWMLVTALGAQYGWSQRTRVLFDLVALAGFGAGLWMTYKLWRARQDDKD